MQSNGATDVYEFIENVYHQNIAYCKSNISAVMPKEMLIKPINELASGLAKITKNKVINSKNPVEDKFDYLVAISVLRYLQIYKYHIKASFLCIINPLNIPIPPN